MKPTELLRKTLLKRTECARCGCLYRGGYTYREMGVCGGCARTLTAQLVRDG